MSCCDPYEARPEETVGVCPKCGSDVDRDGVTTEEGCNYSPSCSACQSAPCDWSC